MDGLQIKSGATKVIVFYSEEASSHRLSYLRRDKRYAD
jgi:hypothetical protein